MINFYKNLGGFSEARLLSDWKNIFIPGRKWDGTDLPIVGGAVETVGDGMNIVDSLSDSASKVLGGVAKLINFTIDTADDGLNALKEGAKWTGQTSKELYRGVVFGTPKELTDYAAIPDTPFLSVIRKTGNAHVDRLLDDHIKIAFLSYNARRLYHLNKFSMREAERVNKDIIRRCRLRRAYNHSRDRLESTNESLLKRIDIMYDGEQRNKKIAQYRVNLGQIRHMKEQSSLLSKITIPEVAIVRLPFGKGYKEYRILKPGKRKAYVDLSEYSNFLTTFIRASDIERHIKSYSTEIGALNGRIATKRDHLFTLDNKFGYKKPDLLAMRAVYIMGVKKIVSSHAVADKGAKGEVDAVIKSPIATPVESSHLIVPTPNFGGRDKTVSKGGGKIGPVPNWVKKRLRSKPALKRTRKIGPVPDWATRNPANPVDESALPDLTF